MEKERDERIKTSRTRCPKCKAIIRTRRAAFHDIRNTVLGKRYLHISISCQKCKGILSMNIEDDQISFNLGY